MMIWNEFYISFKISQIKKSHLRWHKFIDIFLITRRPLMLILYFTVNYHIPSFRNY